MMTSSGTDVLIILFPKTSRVAAQGGLLLALPKFDAWLYNKGIGTIAL